VQPYTHSKRAVHTLNRAIHTPKKALYTLKGALHTLERAIYTPKRALYTLKTLKRAPYVCVIGISSQDKAHKIVSATHTATHKHTTQKGPIYVRLSDIKPGQSTEVGLCNIHCNIQHSRATYVFVIGISNQDKAQKLGVVGSMYTLKRAL